MKTITRIVQENGHSKRVSLETEKLLNLNFLKLTNKAYSCEELGIPEIRCNTKILPDYLALYNHRNQYGKTAYTGVCFYTYDNSFDGLNGLFNAIYYNDKKLLTKYKERFKGVRFLISPDYSQFGDIQGIENMYRLWKARIVTLWFIVELHVITIPNITYISENTFPFFFTGISTCSVVAFSTKGHVRYARERKLLKEAVKYAVDHLPLEAIVVYSVTGKDDTSLKLFKYAIDKGVKVIIPDNELRLRNQQRMMLS